MSSISIVERTYRIKDIFGQSVFRFFKFDICLFSILNEVFYLLRIHICPPYPLKTVFDHLKILQRIRNSFFLFNWTLKNFLILIFFEIL